MKPLHLSWALAEDVEELPIARVRVERRAARLVLNEAQDESGNTARAKVFVDGDYIHGYTPETMLFCSGCKCYKNTETGEVVPCGLGMHEISVVPTSETRYPWHFTHDFKVGDDITKTPILPSVPPGPPIVIDGFIENAVIPERIFIEEPAAFVITGHNLTHNGGTVKAQFRATIEFRAVADPDKKYKSRSEWSAHIGYNESVDLNIEVTLPKSAIPRDELYANYQIYAILEAKI